MALGSDISLAGHAEAEQGPQKLQVPLDAMAARIVDLAFGAARWSGVERKTVAGPGETKARSGPVRQRKRTQSEPHAATGTLAMLARMRTVLEREAVRIDDEGLEGKAAVNLVALMARTLDKIDQMERAAQQRAVDAAEPEATPEDRARLSEDVKDLIVAAARRMVESGEMGEADAPGSHAADPHDSDQTRMPGNHASTTAPASAHRARRPEGAVAQLPAPGAALVIEDGTRPSAAGLSADGRAPP